MNISSKNKISCLGGDGKVELNQSKRPGLRPDKIIGAFRLDYEYEIEYEVERVAHGMKWVCVVIM